MRLTGILALRLPFARLHYAFDKRLWCQERSALRQADAALPEATARSKHGYAACISPRGGHSAYECARRVQAKFTAQEP